ncbi:hypothetical protein NX794_31555 [Streptomyces sp. LP11]|uniref:Uncharacterized protein n=1 Tax=Streptomyces pyxinicus TaxID=2970331 RepID=A0ABT2BBA6_9ACTN|nr:hypothetical protein [Streptomyces sp. LP11]MCS0605705.1 hypothetical protein [Streptomyces sp. LP11]
MGAQRLQEVDQAREGGVLEQIGNIGSAAEVDGDDQGGLLPFSGLLAQAPADGLHGVDDAVAGGGEDHGVDGGHVDALVEHPHVGQDRAGAVGVGEILQQVTAAVGG